MRKKFVGIATLGTVAIALMAGPSVASPPTGLATYAGAAGTLALGLDAPVLDLELTVAETGAAVNSNPTASATGSALFISGVFDDEAASNSPAGPATDQSCAANIPLPSPIDLADLDLACVNTAAAADPSASSTTSEVVLPVGGADLTSQILTPLIEPVITPIIDGLASIPDNLVGAAVAQVVDLIVASLADPAGTTATVTVAPNESTANATAENGVVAHGLSRGAVVEILPDLPAGPFVTVTVGQSEAQVVRNATTGAATPTVTPATIDIDFNTIDVPPITLLGAINIVDISQQVEDAVNGLIQQLATASPLTCSGSNPLADIICFDAASGVTDDSMTAAEAEAAGFPFGDGTAFAQATALHVEVLSAAQGGIVLDLAQAVAAANATPVQPAAPTTTTLPPLARTGSSMPGGAPLLVVFALGLGAMVLTRRAAAVR